MARWVTIRKDAFPFDFRVKSSGAYLQFNLDVNDPEDTGERYVPDDQAEFIIARGYGKAGKAKGSTARSTKSGPAKVKVTTQKSGTKPVTKAKVASDAKAADTGSNASLADPTVAAAGSAGDRSAVDSAAS